MYTKYNILYIQYIYNIFKKKKYLTFKHHDLISINQSKIDTENCILFCVAFSFLFIYYTKYVLNILRLFVCVRK